MSTKESLAEVVPQPCYELGGILYLPHYNKEHVYVSPGYPEFHTNTYTRTELVMLGAVKVMNPLWPRSWLRG
jgi:hypothetical protein